MTKKALATLTLSAALIVFLAVMYVFYPRSTPQVSPDKPGSPSEVPYRTVPEFAEKPAPPGAASPAAPVTPAPPTQAPPPPKLKPPAAQETKPPVVEPEEQFGLLVGWYRTHQEANKVKEEVEKQGKPAFIRHDGRHRKPYAVWAGPFPSREESKLAAKTIRNKLKVAPKTERLQRQFNQVELVETRVNVVIPYGLHIAYNSTLQYDGSIWDRTLIGDDLQIHLAVRTIQGADENFIGTLDYHHKIEVGDKTIPPVDIPAEMEEALDVATLDPTLVSLSLSLLGGLLQDNLDGDRWGIRVPLAGSDLAAGEDFESLLNNWAANLDDELESLSATTAQHLSGLLQTAVTNAFGSVNPGEPQVCGITVDVYCGGEDDCATDDPIDRVSRIDIQLVASQSESYEHSGE